MLVETTHVTEFEYHENESYAEHSLNCINHMIHFPCLSYMTTRFCYLFISYFIMLINFLIFLTHTLLKTDLFINIILGVN